MAEFAPPHGAVNYREENGVAFVILSRPESRNALDRQMMEDLEATWKHVNSDEDVSVVVLAADGDDFSDGDPGTPPGVDDEALKAAQMNWIGFYRHQENDVMAEMGWSPSLDHRGIVQTGVPDRRRGRPAKPLIAAIQGACSGRALSLLAFADFAICSEEAQFFDRRLKFSEPPFAETWAMLKFRVVPRTTGLRMAFEGEHYRLDATRAYQLGTVTEIVPKDALRTRATAIATLIAAASPAAVKGLISGFWSTWDLRPEEARWVGQLHAQQARTMDAREGHAAWVEDREPEWPSRASWSPPWPPVVLGRDGT